MRDTNEDMIEIVGTSNDNNLFTSTVRLTLEGELLTLKFGIVPDDYYNIKRILEFRPFENTAVGQYKYFFAGSYSQAEDLAEISVRVEQQKQNKQFKFTVTKKYVANLLWFQQTKDKTKFETLIVPN